MAGAGFLTFTDGQVLTAAQVNTYLMEQTIMVFATTTARDTAITSPTEGMFAFTKDADKLWFYTGATWTEITLTADITGVTAGTGLSGGGTTGTVTLSIDSTVATLTGTQTLTNKTINGAILDYSMENWNIVASAATGTINLDVLTASIWYYTSNATANHTINVRGNSGTTLSSLLAVGDSMTVVWANTNGATAYRPTTFQVDGATITPKWQGGSAPTAGNASSVDAYSYMILKTAATPTYEVWASQTQFK